jgi:hypothetical protein
VYGEAFIDTVICVTQRKLGHCQNQTRLLKVEKANTTFGMETDWQARTHSER